MGIQYLRPSTIFLVLITIFINEVFTYFKNIFIYLFGFTVLVAVLKFLVLARGI